jgi:hypothetical protein
MEIRDRIQSLRRVPAGSLRANPLNWRTHPAPQRDAIRAALTEIGYASALLARELPDGSLELIDGHLRAETTPEALVPVLVLDLNEAEAAKLLATFDPLAALAEADTAALEVLLRQVNCQDSALRTLLDDLAAEHLPPPASNVAERPNVEVPEMFQVVVECSGERQQQTVYERLTAEGFHCRLLNLG